MSRKSTFPISPHRVRYIKLGEGGRWERSCLDEGVCRIGFGSHQPARFRLCVSGNWAKLAASFRESGRGKGTATRFANELRLFFEDDGSTLWITFSGERLYWGVLDKSAPVPDPSDDGVTRRVVGGWRCTDAHGEELTKERLSGALVKLAAYRGTSCDVDVADYVIRRINGQKTPEVERALAASHETRSAVLGLFRLLTPQDFELLVDLVFTNSGWRRVVVVGKTQKTLDLDIVLPSTGERAFVQVKSKTSSAELTDYIGRIGDGPYSRMFFVFHSGQPEMEEPDPRVTLIGPEQLSDLVVEAGLVGWLIRKVS